MDRGDIYHVDLNPVHGREQTGQRYVLIVSPKKFNQLGTSLVCPITQGGEFSRSQGFAVSLSEPPAAPRAWCSATSSARWTSKQGTAPSSKAPPFIVDEVIARLVTLLE